jgi:hypothetical protein
MCSASTSTACGPPWNTTREPVASGSVMNRFRPPVRRARGGGYALNLSADEIDLLRRVLDELREVVGRNDADQLTQRLFPTAYTDDDEREAEYQRLMRDELVASRLEAIEVVDGVLGRSDTLDEGQLTAFMQSLNAIRLVLGTMLDVGEDDDDAEDDAEDDDDSPEHHLYAYLSWLLEWTVRAMSGR